MSEEFGRRLLAMTPRVDAESKEDGGFKKKQVSIVWDQVEKDVLNGQKMQGYCYQYIIIIDISITIFLL